MAYALIANVSAASGNSNDVTTGAIDTTGADFIVIHVACEHGKVVTPTDSKSNTWSALTLHDSGGGAPDAKLYYSRPSSVGASHTFSFSNAGSFPSIYVSAWSGSVASPFDVENGNGSASASSLSTGSITPTQDADLVIAGFSDLTNNASLAINGGFTITDKLNSSSQNYSGGMAYLIQTTATAANPAWSGFTSACAAVIASFKSTGGGGATRLVKMAGEWGGYAGASGGFAG